MWDFYENNPNAKLPFKKIGPFYYPDNITEYETSLAEYVAKTKRKEPQKNRYLFLMEQLAYKIIENLSYDSAYSERVIKTAAFLSLTPYVLRNDVFFKNRILFMDLFVLSFEYSVEAQTLKLSEDEIEDLRILIPIILSEIISIPTDDIYDVWISRKITFEHICSYCGIDSAVEKCTFFMQYSYCYNQPYHYLITKNSCYVVESLESDDDDIVPLPLMDIYDNMQLALTCRNSFLAFKNGLHGFMH